MQSLWAGTKSVVAAPFRTIDGEIRSGIGGAPSLPRGPVASPPANQVPAGKARALGGPVCSGVPYLVGERGPEIFVPNG
ncbi:hypothetical protein [Methylobacterium sp. CM6257]